MLKRIVVVDDNASIGRFIKTAIEKAFDDFDVVVVLSAEEALLEAGINQVDLIIADIKLPGISGVDLSKRFKARFPVSHVILMTAMDEFPIQAKAEEVGASGYFTKPLDIDALMETVGKCLSIAAKTEHQTDVKAQPEEPVTAPEPVEESPGEESLTMIIMGLRQRLDADSVLLLDERGRIVAQAGELTYQDFETDWGVPITSLTSSGAKLSRLIGEDVPQSQFFFRGDKREVIVAPVGDFAMVVLQKRGETTTLRKVAVMEETRSSQREISGVLKGMGVTLQVLEPSQVVPADAMDFGGVDISTEKVDERITAAFSTGELENLLLQADDVASEEADEFWGSLKEDLTGSVPADPDVLSYDEAVQLGLTPEDEG